MLSAHAMSHVRPLTYTVVCVGDSEDVMDGGGDLVGVHDELSVADDVPVRVDVIVWEAVNGLDGVKLGEREPLSDTLPVFDVVGDSVTVALTLAVVVGLQLREALTVADAVMEDVAQADTEDVNVTVPVAVMDTVGEYDGVMLTVCDADTVEVNVGVTVTVTDADVEGVTLGVGLVDAQMKASCSATHCVNPPALTANAPD